jgi:serine/threonine-protein kinase
MGEVYLAEDSKLDRRVALKVLPTELADDSERLKRLVREAKALAALDHPHIVTVFSVEEDDGVHFLTMAWVEGESLDSLIPEEGLPAKRVLELAVPLADALRAAHERGIIHRDLKPANVMVDKEGRLRVLDFGLAKRDVGMADEMSQASTHAFTEQMTREGTILGSYPYMSPEQAEGRPVDARSDLFSLGVLLYEMATGGRPFQGDTSLSLITAILRDEPRDLTEVKPETPQALGQIVERCLAKDLNERFQSAAEVRDALENLTDEPGRPSSRQLPRWSWASAAAGVALVLLIASIWIWTRRGPPPAAENPTAIGSAPITALAVLPLKNLTGDPEQDYFVDGMTEALITDLSKIGALKVISRSSAMRYKGTDKPISEIATELGVDAVVEGSVIREGDQVGITAQLIVAETDDNLWAERYERDLTSILKLQGEIAQAIAAEIQIVLTPEEQSLLAASQDIDPAAHEAYLKGTFHLQKFTPQDFDLALQYFETAVEIDPDYALAHAGIASAWIYINQLGVAPPSEAIPKVQPALARALEIDPLLADAHLVQAQLSQVWDWDWDAVDESYRRAIELKPNFADAYIFYSHFLSLMGRGEEGTAAAQRALELDPLNPFYHGLYGIQISLTGDIDDAVAQIRRAHEMAPGFNFGRQSLAYILGYAGRREESLAEMRTHYAIVEDQHALEAIDRGELEAGYEGAMKAVADVLAERSKSIWVHNFDVFMLYDLAGEVEQALEWLESGYEVRDPDMHYLGALWLSEEVRDEPGYHDLLRRMDLQDVWSR